MKLNLKPMIISILLVFTQFSLIAGPVYSAEPSSDIPEAFTKEEGAKISQKIAAFFESDQLQPYIQMKTSKWRYQPIGVEKPSFLVGEMISPDKHYIVVFGLKKTNKSDWNVNFLYFSDKRISSILVFDMLSTALGLAKLKAKEELNIDNFKPTALYIKNKDYDYSKQNNIIELVFFNHEKSVGVKATLTPDGVGGTFFTFTLDPKKKQ